MDSDGGRLIDDRYEVGRVLGAGGAAEVFLARDKVLNRTVALKVLDRRLTFEGSFASRFEREACLAASLSHPNVVTVYDLGKTGSGSPYIAMECVGGGTLKDLIEADGPLEVRHAARLALEISHALEEAHWCGLIHRDIKPQNVLLTDGGEAKVADFGVAKVTETTSLTEPGSLVGSVHYLSPEQAAGQEITPRSDLYSLGIVLYEMLSGTRPFEAESWEEGPLAVVNKRLTQDPEPLGDRAPDVPQWLEQATMRLLARNPDERFADAAEFAEVLREGLGIAESTPNRPDRNVASIQPEPCEPETEATVPPDESRERRMLRRASPSAGTLSAGRVRRRKRRRGAIATTAAALVVSAMLLVAGASYDWSEAEPPRANDTDAGNGQSADPGGGADSPLFSFPSSLDPGSPIPSGSTSPQDQYR